MKAAACTLSPLRERNRVVRIKIVPITAKKSTTAITIWMSLSVDVIRTSWFGGRGNGAPGLCPGAPFTGSARPGALDLVEGGLRCPHP